MYAWQFAKAQHIAEKNGWTRRKNDIENEESEGAETDAFAHQRYYADSDFSIVDHVKLLAEKKQ